MDTLDEDSGDDVTLIGDLGHLKVGERARVEGTWEEHARYGHQLRAATALPLDPPDRAGQLAYLTTLHHIGEGRARAAPPAAPPRAGQLAYLTTLHHIGEVRAETLLGMYGETVLDRIAADP